jgi:beta-N-acetylhexosaminidase
MPQFRCSLAAQNDTFLMRTEDNEELTLQVMIGERLMPKLEIDCYCEDSGYASAVQTWVGEHKVGGFCIFGGTPQRVIQVVTALQEITTRSHGTSLLFSADCEWGLPMRLREGGTEFPDAMAIAHAKDPALNFGIGRAISSEMKALGLSWNFAPVADVNSNPLNPIINTRAFSENPTEAAEQACLMLSGIQSGYVAATTKHFPGHGDTTVDSHSSLPFIDGTLEDFEKRELIPFHRAIKEGVRSIMLGHIAVPNLAKDLEAKESELTLPATLSRPIIQSLLRKRMAFAGVIVTDALDMHAITKAYGSGQASVLAITAGVDIALMPENVDEAYGALLGAAEAGEFSREELLASYRRIRELKQWASAGKVENGVADLARLETLHTDLAKDTARKAIVIKGDRQHLIGLADVVIICDQRDVARTRAEYFLNALLGAGKVKSGKVMNMGEALEQTTLTPKTMLVTFHRARGYLGGSPTGGPAVVTMPHVIRRIAERSREHSIVSGGFILFGSPYLDSEFVEGCPNVILKTFSESMASIDAVLDILSKL